MKPLIPILVVATTSLAVASVQYAQQASVQRKRADAEMALRQKQEVRVAQLERAQARLERELLAAQGTAGASPPPRAEAGAGAPTQRAGAPGERKGAFAWLESGGGNVPPPPLPGRGPRMLESPAARNFMRSRMKSSIRRMYEDAGPALGLSAEKTNQLVDLLADQQTRNMGRAMPADGQGMQQYFRDQQQKDNAELAALIGQDKLDEWAQYQKSLPDRAQLGQVREQLETAGVPMTEGQRTELLAAIAEERERLPRPAYDSGLPQEELMAQMNQWQSDYDQALLDRAKQVLNTEQYNSYKEYQDWQAEMRKSFSIAPGGRGAARVGVMAPGMALDSGVTFMAAPVLSTVPAPQPAERR